MACVYWIHLQEHTDMLNEGYIGYTARDASERFVEHRDRSKCRAKKNSRKRTILDRAIQKHKDALVVSTICICDEEYGLWLENRLRPEKKTGWNIAIGGGKPPGVKGLPVSQETREKLRKALTGRVVSEESKAKFKKTMTGRKLSQEHKRKISLAGMGRTWVASSQAKQNMSAAQKKFFDSKEWWELKSSEHQMLNAKLADVFETVISKFPNETVRTYCKALNVPYHFSREEFVKRFRSGYSTMASGKWQTSFSANDYSLVDESVFVKKEQPWANPKADKIVWSNAVAFTAAFARCDFKKLSHFMFKRYDKLDVLHKFVVSGWNPSEDDDYLLWRDSYLQKLKETNGT